MKKVSAAWLAGVIDSDGCLFFNAQRKNICWKRCQITVCNTNLTLIHKAQNLMGGYISMRKPKKDKLIQHRKIMYQLRESAHLKCLTLLKQLLPYLTAKKNYAKQMVTFIKKGKWEKR